MKTIDEVKIKELEQDANLFLKKVNADMFYKSNLASDLMNTEWLNQVEITCPYIDNIVRAPKLTLVSDENVLKIEKVKKVTVASVKDLSMHTQYIEKIDPVTHDVQPSKVLDVRSEDSFNTYENRFLYTLMINLEHFMMLKKDQLDKLDISSGKILEYQANTVNSVDSIKIEMRITSEELPKDASGGDIEDELNSIKERMQKVNEFINSWHKSEMIKSLTKLHVPLVRPPIKKTNLILRNPNFQMMSRLWSFLQTYNDDDVTAKDAFNTNGNDTLKDLLNDSFLTDYYVLNAINPHKKEQKEKIGEYALLMIKQQMKRALALLLDSGIKFTDEDLINLIKNAYSEEKNNRLLGGEDVKKKFKSAMDEYLSKTKEII